MRIFSLDNFEGPIDLLIYLIQKQELEICDILLKNLTQQFFQNQQDTTIEQGSDFLGMTSTLLLIKSRKLLPKDIEQPIDSEDDVPKWEIFQQLLEYHQFKQIANHLTVREIEQSSFFSRGVKEFSQPKPTGLDEVTLKELSQILKDLMAKASFPQEAIKEEPWHVSDKMNELLEKIYFEKKIELFGLFESIKNRLELIVTFLAILELMKDQKILIVRENEELYITSHAERTQSI